MRFTLMVFLVISMCAVGGSLKRSLGMAWAKPSPKPSALRLPPVVEIWPGTAPDESGNIGEEKFRMSPKLDRKQVEVTEPTRLVTNVTKPTLTIYRPVKEKDTGTAVLICPGGGYWDLEGKGHRDCGADMPRGRLLGPLLATRRRGSCRLVELNWRNRHHPQVPCAAPAR